MVRTSVRVLVAVSSGATLLLPVYAPAAACCCCYSSSYTCHPRCLLPFQKNNAGHLRVPSSLLSIMNERHAVWYTPLGRTVALCGFGVPTISTMTGHAQPETGVSPPPLCVRRLLKQVAVQNSGRIWTHLSHTASIAPAVVSAPGMRYVWPPDEMSSPCRLYLLSSVRGVYSVCHFKACKPHRLFVFRRFVSHACAAEVAARSRKARRRPPLLTALWPGRTKYDGD